MTFETFFTTICQCVPGPSHDVFVVMSTMHWQMLSMILKKEETYMLRAPSRTCHFRVFLVTIS